jgi:Ca2+/Na+ antiporter
MITYEPIFIYIMLLTFFTIMFLFKLIKYGCKSEATSAVEDTQNDRKATNLYKEKKIIFIFSDLKKALISPDIYVIPISHGPLSINSYDDTPPPYEQMTPPPKYEELFKD